MYRKNVKENKIKCIKQMHLSSGLVFPLNDLIIYKR